MFTVKAREKYTNLKLSVFKKRNSYDGIMDFKECLKKLLKFSDFLFIEEQRRQIKSAVYRAVIHCRNFFHNKKTEKK